MPGDDSGDDWLAELLTAHRQEPRDRQDSKDDQENEEFLVELLTCHRPENHTSGSASGSASSRVQGSRLEVPNSSCVHTYFSSSYSSTVAEPKKRQKREILQLGQARKPWDEFLPLLAPLGPLPTVTLPDRHAVLWALPPEDPEHSPYIYAVRRLAAWQTSVGPIAFKIGIAADPEHRFWNTEFGYHKEKMWHFMEVTWKGPANEIRDLEIQLIAGLSCLSGCYNQSPGGEGVSAKSTHTCYQYFVVAPCGSGVGLRKAWELVDKAGK